MTDEEIKRAVAEKIMGIQGIESRLCEREPECGQWVDSYQDNNEECEWLKRMYCYQPHGPDTSYWIPIPDPLTSETDCAAVLDKMAEKFDCFLHKCDAKWKCYFTTFEEVSTTQGRDVRGQHFDRDRKRAICLAALKAMGVSVE